MVLIMDSTSMSNTVDLLSRKYLTKSAHTLCLLQSISFGTSAMCNDYSQQWWMRWCTVEQIKGVVKQTGLFFAHFPWEAVRQLDKSVINTVQVCNFMQNAGVRVTRELPYYAWEYCETQSPMIAADCTRHSRERHHTMTSSESWQGQSLLWITDQKRTQDHVSFSAHF